MTKIDPQIMLVANEVTELMTPGDRAKYGRTFELFVTDASVHTYICSLTPMLFLRGYETVSQIYQEDDDEWYELASTIEDDYYGLEVLRTGLTEDVTKYHIADYPGRENRDEYNEWFEDIVEYYQCNPHYPSGLLAILEEKDGAHI